MKSPGSCWILCSLITSFTAFALAVTIISSILFSCFPDSLAVMFSGSKPVYKGSRLPPLLFNTSFLMKAASPSGGGGLADLVHLEAELELGGGGLADLVHLEDELEKIKSGGGGLAEIVHLEEELEQLEMQVEAVQRPVHQKLKGGRLGEQLGGSLPSGKEEEEEKERKPCLMLKFHGVRLVCKRRRKAHR